MHRRGFLAGAAALLPLVAGCSGGDGGAASDGGGGGGYGGGAGGATTTTAPAGGTTTSATTSEDAPTTATTDEPTTAEPTTTTARTTTDGSAAARQAYPNYDWGQLDGAEATAATEVTLRSSRFAPLVAEVSAGSEVTFVNEDVGRHSVTVPALDVDEVLAGGESTTVAFEDAGVFDYVCTFHPPQMLGRVVVG